MGRPKQKSIPFAKGFQLRSEIDIRKALLCKPNKISIDNESKFRQLINHFGNISQPKHELDWLARYKVKGQDCLKFSLSTPLNKSELGISRFIYFVKIGPVSSIDFDELIDYCKKFFPNNSVKVFDSQLDLHETKIKTKFQITSEKINIKNFIKGRYNHQNSVFQLQATSIHKILKNIKPKDAHCLIGFSEYDLYKDDEDLFVAGLACGSQGVAVFSSFRYNPSLRFSEEKWQETWKVKTKNKKSEHLLRTCRLMVHETCHLLGMAHCVFLNCCMNGSGHLKEDFSQSHFLCPIDLKKLNLVIDFDIKSYYKNLKEFFEKHNAKTEVKWLATVLSSL